ncbi:TPA: hypothetical protein NEG48_003657 [Elizabethkingia anophelis]|nr:hypothetical protein [Elizabethkingia anophelis]
MRFKFTLLFISILVFNIFHSQTFEWTPDRKLNFDDFRGSVPEITNGHAAEITAGLKYETGPTSIWTGRFKIKISAVFDSEKSWVIKKYMLSDGERIINHEQKHFDIAQAFALKLQKEVNKEIKGIISFHKKFQNLYDKFYADYVSFQTKYDLETAHGTILSKQKEYDELISKMILNKE